jgi:hypothetical protein
MTRQQKLVIFGCAVLIVGGVIFKIVSSRNAYDPTETLTNSASESKVIITNADDYSTWFDTNRIPDVESALYARVKQSAKLTAASYDATIRKDSLQTTYNTYNGGDGPSQVPTVSFLVDIPKASQSYKVTFSGGDGYPYNILHVLCPDPSQLVYGNFGCKDPEQ